MSVDYRWVNRVTRELLESEPKVARAIATRIVTEAPLDALEEARRQFLRNGDVGDAEVRKIIREGIARRSVSAEEAEILRIGRVAHAVLAAREAGVSEEAADDYLGSMVAELVAVAPAERFGLAMKFGGKLDHIEVGWLLATLAHLAAEHR